MIPFEEIAAQIGSARHSSVAARVRLFESLAPSIAEQIDRDRGSSGPMIFWGTSSNFDELAQAEIVDPAILEPLLRLAGQPEEPLSPHAGLQHTYGYLFSTIDTPFGKKRDRWTGTGLEQSLGLKPDTLSPQPSGGTLLSNATWVAGQVAFAGSQRLNWLERCLRHRVSTDLHTIDWSRGKSCRLIESVAAPRSEKRIQICTDVIRMPVGSRRVRPSSDWLLVYSVHDERERWPKLVTMFTVGEAFVEALQERGRIRRRSDIRLRFNAVVAGLPSHELSGTVQLVRRPR